ncbi:hypothetical protein SKC41_23415 [Mycobacterium sp. 050128]|uniref:hypothetical protein n=1 Tax=Mycobacterium sp. 050128 TaxID=3096112 RepID=UPI002ED8C1C9
MTAFEKRCGIVVRDRPGRQLIEQSKSAEAKLSSVSNLVVHAIHPPVIVARHS